MGIIIRQSIKSSIVSYVGVAIGTVNFLWLSAKFMPPSHIGLTKVLLEAAMLFYFFAQLGTAHIADRFFPHFKNYNKSHNGFLFFLLLYPLFGFILFCGIYIIFNDLLIKLYIKKAPLLSQYRYFALPLTFFIVYQLILESYSRIHLRIVVPTIIREIFLKISNTIIIILYATNVIDLHGFILCMIASYGLAVILLLLYIKSLGVLFLKPDFSWFNWPFFKDMIFYGMYIIMGGLGVMLVYKIDVLMLPAFTGLDFTAIYMMATLIATVIEIPKRAVTQISIPVLSQAWKDNDLSRIAELYQKTSINQLLAGAFIFLGIWCNIDALFNIIPNAEIYQQGKYVVLFLGIAKLIDMATGINAEIILYSKYYRFALTATMLLAILTITSNSILIPLFGINGAGIATAFSILIYTTIKFVYVWIRFKLQPYTIKSLLALGVILVTLIGVSLLPAPGNTFIESVINILMRSVIITILYGSLSLYFKISEDVNKIFLIGSNRLSRIFNN